MKEKTLIVTGQFKLETRFRKQYGEIEAIKTTPKSTSSPAYEHSSTVLDSLESFREKDESDSIRNNDKERLYSAQRHDLLLVRLH